MKKKVSLQKNSISFIFTIIFYGSIRNQKSRWLQILKNNKRFFCRIYNISPSIYYPVCQKFFKKCSFFSVRFLCTWSFPASLSADPWHRWVIPLPPPLFHFESPPHLVPLCCPLPEKFRLLYSFWDVFFMKFVIQPSEPYEDTGSGPYWVQNLIKKEREI